MHRKQLLAALLLAAACVPAAAQSRWYAGASIGQSDTDSELVANRESTITNASGISTDFDSRDTAWKVFGGMRLNSVLAVEVNAADLGSHRMHTTFQGGFPPAPSSVTIHREISGWGVDLVATPPLGWERFSIFGRAGAFRARLEADATLDGNVVFTGGDPAERTRSTTRRETVFKLGLGAEWRFARNAALRVEWERYHEVGKPFEVGGQGTTGQADTDVFSIGALMSF